MQNLIRLNQKLLRLEIKLNVDFSVSYKLLSRNRGVCIINDHNTNNNFTCMITEKIIICRKKKDFRKSVNNICL